METTIFSVPLSPCESEIPFGPYLQDFFVIAWGLLTRGFFVIKSWPNGMVAGFSLKSELPLSGQSLPPAVSKSLHIDTLHPVDQPTAIPFGRKSETVTRQCTHCRKSQNATRESKRAKRNPVHARAGWCERFFLRNRQLFLTNNC